MKIRFAIRRWYVVLVVKLPGMSEPACIGFGLPRDEQTARDTAVAFAQEIL